MAHADDAPLHDDEIESAAALVSWSFAFPMTDAVPWLRGAGLENLHGRRKNGALQAALMTIPMGQYFGGKSVPMVGIAGVAVAPEARGTGAAQALLQRVMHEQRHKGFALSTLYPATLGLYRKLGYELAGALYAVKAPLAGITLRDHELPLRPMTDADAPAVEACYGAKASRINGLLDRGPYVWKRVRVPRAGSPRGFVVGEEDRVEGYLFVYEKRDASLHYSLEASDFVATTPRAVRRLLTFAADHGTLGTDLNWSASPTDPSVHLLPRTGRDVSVREVWMLRILDVERAMTERGWPAHVKVEMDLDVLDDGIAENAGRWSLRVAEGRAQMARGGTGAIRIDIRALASLYTGWRDPFVIAGAGGIDGSDGDLASLAAAFAGASPWMPDFF